MENWRTQLLETSRVHEILQSLLIILRYHLNLAT
jgi:hypothetical protein